MVGIDVKGELDSEDLIAKVVRGRRRPRIDGQANSKTELCRRDRDRESGWRSDSGKMKLFRNRRRSESLGEGFGTAVLRTVAESRLAGHVAIGTHAVHGHWAAGDTGCGRALNAGQNGECGLNSQETDQQNRRELDAPSHLLIVKIVGWIRGGLCFGSHRAKRASLRQHFHPSDGGVAVDRNKVQNQLALRVGLQAGESPDHDV